MATEKLEGGSLKDLVKNKILKSNIIRLVIKQFIMKCYNEKYF